jgi:hypothetical protein
VEVSFGWVEPSFSKDSNGCFEVARLGDAVLVRDSKYSGPAADQPVIAVAVQDWPTLLNRALAQSSGPVNDAVSVALHEDGAATLTSADEELSYTPAEWDAFAKGVADGQFTRP